MDEKRSNRDTLKTVPKCIKECLKFMEDGKSIVIDNTNPSVENRAKFIEIAKINNYKLRCFVMTTQESISKHNTCFRQYISKGKIDYISNIVYNIYKKKYSEPSNKEGFDEIIHLPFLLDENVDNDIYRMYFLTD